MNDLKIFSGTANQALAKRITDYLGVPLGDIALGKFPDGEISCKINEDILRRIQNDLDLEELRLMPQEE